MKLGSGDETAPKLNLDLELLTRGDDEHEKAKPHRKRKRAAAADGVFECKTCHLRFATFQALGGHRTSHMRCDRKAGRLEKAGVCHRCTVCGARFEMGQALGGHMRRHKAAGGCWKERRRAREVVEIGVVPLEVNMFDVVRRSASACELLQLFV
ncbi:zinc finger protein ZAT18-like [Zingiber officinale]|uniref:C2H2-type domain-containing protein n=1 Tax=Zingiber officinale TaxID=94328 RepID=A0A8J5FJW6_ZINOF|nr:zinc finger protein ZAT18-like [Zingiber officinale]KAG6488864.1 hypothetical protein ZIOFF_050118 [Zingiber officinale]